MDSKKDRNSQTSSEENDQPEKSNDENSGVGRSYECTFCKRGFTNAQALGGHMNIHRKDKAKAKNHTHQQQPSFYNKPNEDHYVNSRYFVPNEFFGAQMNYQFYFPAPNPSYPLSYYQSDHFSTAPRADDVGVNLSLGIGTSHMEDSKGKKRDERGNRVENEVDLELRLGHDP